LIFSAIYHCILTPPPRAISTTRVELFSSLIVKVVEVGVRPLGEKHIDQSVAIRFVLSGKSKVRLLIAVVVVAHDSPVYAASLNADSGATLINVV
jgi:hypothetical protein